MSKQIKWRMQPSEALLSYIRELAPYNNIPQMMEKAGVKRDYLIKILKVYDIDHKGMHTVEWVRENMAERPEPEMFNVDDYKNDYLFI